MYRRALHNAKVLEAKRNGGLDLLKTAVSSVIQESARNPLPVSGFFFSPLWGQMFEYVGMFYAAKAKTYYVSQSI